MRQKSFGASIANFVAHRYEFLDGHCLFISHATQKTMDKSELANMNDVRDWFQALLDFKLFTKLHTRENFGDWLNSIRLSAGCKPALIRGHTIDGDKNSGKSVEQLDFMTEDDRPQNIMTNPCDAHKINTSFTQGSGTSAHMYNLNTNCGNSFTKLNVYLVQTNSYGNHTAVYNDVQR